MISILYIICIVNNVHSAYVSYHIPQLCRGAKAGICVLW